MSGSLTTVAAEVRAALARERDRRMSDPTTTVLAEVMAQTREAIARAEERQMSDPTTDALAELRAELARVAELEAKAAPGPWKTGGSDHCRIENDLSSLLGEDEIIIYDEGGHDEDDAAFICAARAGYPRLARVVAAVLARCDEIDQPGRHPDRRQVAAGLRNVAAAAWGTDE